MSDEIQSHLPLQEKEQPDPMLQVTTGRIGAGGLTLFAIAAIAILCIVFFGLSNWIERSAPQQQAATATNSAPAPAAPAKTNNPKG